MSILEEEMNIRVQRIMDHINADVDDLWEGEYPNFPKEHALKSVLRAAILMDITKKVTESLTVDLMSK